MQGPPLRRVMDLIRRERARSISPRPDRSSVEPWDCKPKNEIVRNETMLATTQFEAVAEHSRVDARQIDLLIAWLTDGARSATSMQSFVEELCRRMVAAAIPLDRFGLFIHTLHPNVAARRFLWTGAAGVTMQEGPISLFSQDQHLKNPLPLVTSRQTSVRRMLTSPAALDELAILGELRDEGFTDYLVQPLIFTTGETHAATFSTKHPAGFTGEQLTALERVRQPLARIVEAHLLRTNAACIISTYAGRGSGGQILQGRVHRGDGEEIAAAILFADLIGFTDLSNNLSGQQMVETLNDAFDVVVPLVAANGGEVLKFLGDGFFAVFPYDEVRVRPSWRERRGSPKPRSARRLPSAGRSMPGVSTTATSEGRTGSTSRPSAGPSTTRRGCWRPPRACRSSTSSLQRSRSTCAPCPGSLPRWSSRGLKAGRRSTPAERQNAIAAAVSGRHAGAHVRRVR